MSLQLSCYDQAKQLVLATGLLSDNIFAHFLSSFIAVSGAGVQWQSWGWVCLQPDSECQTVAARAATLGSVEQGWAQQLQEAPGLRLGPSVALSLSSCWHGGLLTWRTLCRA